MREKESFLWGYFSNLIKFFFLIYFHHETVLKPKDPVYDPKNKCLIHTLLNDRWILVMETKLWIPQITQTCTSPYKKSNHEPNFFFKTNWKKVKFEINCKIPPFWCSLQNSQMKTPLMLLESPGGFLLLTGKSDILSVFKNRYRGGILECRQTIPLKIPPLGFSDVIGKPETSY